MSSVRIPTTEDEVITAMITDTGGTGVTGLSPSILIRRKDDDEFWTGAGYQATDPGLTMAEVDAAEAPGQYDFAFVAAGRAAVAHSVVIDAGGTAANVPQSGEVVVGGQPGDVADVYCGRLYFDSVNGAAGAVVGVNGTPGNPTSDEADLRSLITSTGIRQVNVVGSLTLAATYTDIAFFGGSQTSNRARIFLNSQDVDAVFHNIHLRQGHVGGRITAYNCDVANGFTGNGEFYDCLVGGTHNLDDGTTSTYSNCVSKFGVAAFWNLSFFASTGSTEAIISNFYGEVQVSEMDQATDVLDAWMIGQLVIDNLSTQGSITLAGHGTIVDNSLAPGVTIDRTAFIESPNVLATAEALVGRIEIDTSVTPWRENHYDLLTRTSIVRAFELFDRTGAAISGDETGGNNPLADADVLVARKVLV